MGHLRERHNARARQSSHPRKRRKLTHGTESTEVTDPNAELHIPKSKDQKAEERRKRLRLELLDQQENSKASSKKKKRLEKYIDKKLKKEERMMLFEKLAQSQAQVPSLLRLQPSSTLGSQKIQTNEEIQNKLEDEEVRLAMQGRAKGRRRKRNVYSGMDGASEDDPEDEIDSMSVEAALRPVSMPRNSRESPVTVEDERPDTKSVPEIADSTIGSALRKSADGTVQAPIVIKKRQKGPNTAFRSWLKGSFISSKDDHSSDSSFDSSDSANDLSDEDEEEDAARTPAGSSEDDRGSDAESEWKGFGSDNPSEGDKGGGSSTVHDDGNDTSDEDAGEEELPLSQKRGGFKDWALQQLSTAKEYVAPPSKDEQGGRAKFELSPAIQSTKQNIKKEGPREMKGPLGETLQLPATAFAEEFKTSTLSAAEPNSKKLAIKYLNIERSYDVQAARLQLPILAEEQPIVEAVRLNPVVVLCGETGSGKTTQVPQFLYEAGFGCPGSDNSGMIGITQPRRVAAMSMATRVGQELALPSRVAYQVRYDTTTASTTAIKFMTDGVLLRELASDFSLSKYSVIIVDEAHERSVNTDILIGVLSRVVRLREELWKEGKENAKPLRLIIMSATLRVSDFAENTTLFPSPPPILRIDARQYTVAVHFARRTYPEYVSEAVKKTCKIHARLPPGGILVFLTGQNEITGVCRKLEGRYGKEAIATRKRRRAVPSVQEEETVDAAPQAMKVAPAVASVEIEEMEFGDLAADVEPVDDGDQPRDLDPEALDSDEEDDENRMLGIDTEDSEVPMHILPLYSILPTDQQMRVFQQPPEGSRLVVVATNVAETSLTIPGIRYVVDCGRAKERCYDNATGVQSFRINWISKASAEQRSGRAGRTGPGHCYRLYSSSLYENHFDQYTCPEILRMPIEGVVLQMKSMHIDTVTNFPFPTPPDRSSLRKAENLLTYLSALSFADVAPQGLTASVDGAITELGRAMALFPLSPRFSRMLVSGRQYGCLPYVIAIVASSSVGDPFLHEEALQSDQVYEEENEKLSLIEDEVQRAKEVERLRRKAFFKSQEVHSRLGKRLSDIFRILSVVGAYEFAGGGHTFCTDHFVRPKAMEEIHKLRAQISSIVSVNFPGSETGFESNLKPPNDLQVKVLRQLICSAFIDQVAARKDLVQTTSPSGNKYASCQGVPYRAFGVSEDVFIHPSSVLFSRAPPDFVVFQEAMQSSKVWIKTLTVVNPVWLTQLGKGSLCTFSKPLKNNSGKFMVVPRFGPDAWELPAVAADSIK